METLVWIFWLSAAWLLYVYAGYPLALFVLRPVLRRQVAKQDILPRVTLVTAAFNERAHIGDTLRNKLELDYPRELLEIIVIADESTDGTDEVVAGFSAQGVKLLRQAPRQGKTAALNLAMRQACGDIIVFSDANSLYARDVLLKLTRNFADPQVGYVTGKMVYVNPDGSLVGDGCSAYMRYENVIRALESEVGSVVGVDGGIDAVRRVLYRPMRADQLPDFVLPLGVVEQGFRVVYEPEAMLQEHALNASKDEFRMRVRVALRALWALWDMRGLLVPLKHGLFGWQLWSHKVLRYLAFFPMTAMLAASLLLWSEGPVYRVALAAQSLLYALAVAGLLAPAVAARSRLMILPNYFLLLNIASAVAFWRFLKREKQVIWKPRTG